MGQQLERDAFHSLWRTMLRRVRRRFFWLDQAKIEDALADAILRRFAQDGGEVEGVREGTAALSVHSLYSDVCRRVGHSIRADRRRRRREQEYSCQKKYYFLEDFFVRNRPSVGNISIAEQKDELTRLLEDFSTSEQAFVELRKQGMRDVTAYADVLGVSQSPPEEQQRAIKRFWDRLRKKLQRRRERQAQDSDR